MIEKTPFSSLRQNEKDISPENKTRKKLCPLPGRLLNRLPRIRLFYPLYLTDQLRVCDEAVLSPRVPAEFDGFSFLFLSDIHYGPYFSRVQGERLKTFFERFPADALLLGGDIGMDRGYADDFFNAFSLPAFPAGVFAVPGNHDAFGEKGAPHFDAILRSRGIHLLNDRIMPIKRGGKQILLKGHRDYFSGSASPLSAGDSAEKNPFTVLMIHNPDQLVEWKNKKTAVCFDLCLCGHTHGGQVALLGHSVISSCRYGDHYRTGWYETDHGHILVSNGVGTSLLPIRFGAVPQAHRITLVRADKKSTERKIIRL